MENKAVKDKLQIYGSHQKVFKSFATLFNWEFGGNSPIQACTRTLMTHLQFSLFCTFSPARQ